MLALSTACFTLRDPEPSGEAILREIGDLGFRAVELDYRVSEEQLKVLRKAVIRGELEAVSVHHPFPRDPEVVPSTAHLEKALLSGTDREERGVALRLATRTLTYAADLGVDAVVLHLGEVVLPEEINPRDLGGMVREGLRQSPEYEERRRRVADARARFAAAHLDAALWSLDRLAEEALRREVHLGLENRYHPHQIPNREEYAVIFREFEGAPVGYWHDTGHAASLEALGFLASQTELLEAFRERLVGFHLHDARGVDDHLAPGQGALDFSSLVPFVVEGVHTVLEVHSGATPEALLRGRRVLEEAGFGVARPAPAVPNAGTPPAGNLDPLRPKH